jgi:hypothetical protein
MIGDEALVHPIVRRIDEGCEVDVISLAEMAEDAPRADLVALVRRIGDPMTEEEKIAHRC